MTDGRSKTRNVKPRNAAAAPCTLTIDITGDGPDETIAWTCLGAHDPAALATEVAGAIAATIELPARETSASLMLSDDAGVRAFNRQWRGIDKPTNVLSFPMPPPPGAGRDDPLAIGDIVIAEQTLAREARETGISVHDHFRHLVLHGLLHLLGYDHEHDDEAEVMEALETRILATLGVPDPYAGTDPAGRDDAPAVGSLDPRLR